MDLPKKLEKLFCFSFLPGSNSKNKKRKSSTGYLIGSPINNSPIKIQNTSRTKMSAAMSPKIAAVFCFVFTVVYCGKYKPIEVEIKKNEGGVPLKIFTVEELAKYDATDVSLT